MATPNSSGTAAPVSRPEEGLHLRLDKLASRVLSDLYGLHATLIALNRIGSSLVERIEAPEDGQAIERLAGDSKQAVDSLVGFIDDTLRPIIEELSRG